MSVMPQWIRDQMGDTYRRMAVEARYRPAAPSDLLGDITVPVEELDLDAEARTYADRWWKEEDDWDFFIGCCNGSTRPATVYAIEAARNLCAGSDRNDLALQLLRMAVADLEAER